MKNHTQTLVLAVLLLLGCAHLAAAEPRIEGDRVIAGDASASFERPDATWTLRDDEWPVLVRIVGDDGVSSISLQAQPVPGMTLTTLKPMLVQALSEQFVDFELIAESDVSHDGLEAYEVICRGRSDEGVLQSRMVFLLDAGRLFTLAATTTAEQFDSMAEAFGGVVGSLVLSTE